MTLNMSMLSMSQAPVPHQIVDLLNAPECARYVGMSQNRVVGGLLQSQSVCAQRRSQDFSAPQAWLTTLGAGCLTT